jgi:foldase protein PrsA
MNKIKKTLALMLALCMVLAVTACQDKNTGAIEEGVKAKVNDKVVTEKEFDEAVAYYKQTIESQLGAGTWESERTKGQTWKAYYEEKILDDLITRKLILEAAEKADKVATDDEVQHELDYFKAIYFSNDEEYNEYIKKAGITEEYLKEELKNDVTVNNYLMEILDGFNPTDEELTTMFNDLKMQESVKASHILVQTEEEANAVIERLNKGESFEDLAKELSIDTVSGAAGGDLDYFTFIDMVKPFSEAAFSAEIGEISKPVKSDFGYHIIKVTDKKIDSSITLETAKADLTEYYQSMKYQEFLNNLKEEADIIKN